MQAIKRLARWVMSEFVPDRRGNVAIMLAASCIAIVGGVGAMTDFGRAYNVRGRMQGMVDGALLAAAHKSISNDEDLRSVLDTLLAVQWTSAHGVSTLHVVDANDRNGRFEAVVRADVPTTFLGVMGYETVPVDVRTSITYGTGKIELVLVLDNTTSMEGSKMDALREAATDLVEKLMSGSGESEDVKIGLVPFSQYVNVGLSRRSESWLDVIDDYSETRETCEETYPQINCREYVSYYDLDGVMKPYRETICDDDTSVPPTEVCTVDTRDHIWRGCVGSRDIPLDVTDSPSPPIPGLMDLYCPVELQPLSGERATITTAISSMTPSGRTYISTGLMWGWRVLSPGVPFTEGVSYEQMNSGTEPVRKIIVLMTDGENTVSPRYPDHSGTDEALSNARTATACQNIKATGIEIYTMTFDVTDSTVKSLMEDCATGEPYYFDASGISELVSAFKAIGQSLTNLRIDG